MALNRDRLRNARLAQGLSQRELSRRSGIGEQQIWRYENEGNDPPSDILARIARILAVSSDYLLDLTDNPAGHLGDTMPIEHQRLIQAFEAVDVITLLEMIANRIRETAKP
jgi:transcriptional regulator with XRE-family HTH domain